MKKLYQLISEKESELQNLEDSLGLGFPIVEQAKMTQISHLRLELEDLRQIEKSIQLNDNQKIVLEWLKEAVRSGEYEPMHAISYLHTRVNLPTHYNESPYKEYYTLDNTEEMQVLMAFAQWGLEQEEA